MLHRRMGKDAWFVCTKQQIKTRYLCDIAIFPCFSVHGKKSNCLQSAKVPLISERECRRMYADSTRDIDKG